jgi:hypothetical protein
MDETVGIHIARPASDVVAAACPYCVDMLADRVTLRQQQGGAPGTSR